jgi:cytochrome P450
MRWICCGDKANDTGGNAGRSNDNASFVVPTAVQRAAAAKSAREQGYVTLPSKRDPVETHYLLCPAIAKNLLEQHEYDSRSNNHHKLALLRKPCKENSLLSHSLTNSNGADWSRQRPLVQRAFGRDAKSSRKNAVDAAIRATSHFLESKFTNSTNSSSCRVVDVREMALAVAIEAIVTAVFGEQSVNHRVKECLQARFDPTLRPVRGGDSKNLPGSVQELGNIVSQLVSKMAQNDSRVDCLASSLLEFEAKDDAKADFDGSSCLLSRDEVISNCHSALTAGTQTICTTLCGALAHMAERPDLQDDKRSVHTRDVTMETLRILPPVASLPRCPLYHDLEIRGLDKEKPAILHPGDTLIIDLLAFAHANGEGDESWRFDPVHNKLGSAAPWGLGERRCPAGALSVDCISSVVTKILEDGYRWNFCNMEKDSVGETGQNGWVQSVSYTPTLTYPNPLFVTFVKIPTQKER